MDSTTTHFDYTTVDPYGLKQRFSTKWQLEPRSGCHIWTGAMTVKGYGKFRVGPVSVVAHRVAWFLHTGNWPAKNQKVAHLCHANSCVNPDHLRLMPLDKRDLALIQERLDRTAKKAGFGRRPDPSRCLAGKHLWIAANIRLIDGSPTCLQCSRDNNRIRAQQRAWLKKVEKA